eukprot:Skav216530  [mRNA]  locus=scaffold1003:355152:355358:- [translate_table: standard]
MEAGANCNQARTDNGMSPLYAAAENGHFEVVLLLMEVGADWFISLYIAAQNGNLEVVRLLNQAAAEIL